VSFRSVRLLPVRIRPSAVVAFASLLLSSAASAATIRVPEDQPTIQAGINAAAVGDTVDVACGTYHENKVGVRRGVTLRSRTGNPACVTIDGDRLGAVIKFDGADVPTRIEGLTITNGSSPAVGGVSMLYSTAVEIRDCIIRDNFTATAGTRGAGIYAYYSDFVAEHTEIVGNVPGSGGTTVYVYEGSLELYNCTLADNGGTLIGGLIHSQIYDRCIFSGGSPSAVLAAATCSCFWPDAATGTNFTADPLFCNASSRDYGLQPGSPCLPGENACGLVGANPLTCGTPSLVSVTVDTSPSGHPVVVDGVPYTAPAAFQWYEYSPHTVSMPTTPASGGTRYRWDSWSDGLGQTHEAWAPTGGGTFTATLFPQHLLTVVDNGGGATSPPDAWYDEGTAVSISADPDPGQYLEGWAGSGTGSYTGADNPAGVVVNGPVTQSAKFAPISFDLTISASATSPFKTYATPAQATRPLYLWLTCSNAGIAALEAAVTGTLVPTAFLPDNGVLNAGSAASLLLAIPGCPVGNDAPMLLGHWMVGDGGGTLCLTKSPTTDRITGVDCDATPGIVLVPRVVGFSSDSSIPPCATGTDLCGDTEVPAPFVVVSAPDVAKGAQPLRVTGPNPFGEGTRFSFALDREAAVRLTVYDILGRRVRTLAAGSRPSGAHQVAWDGADEGGLPLPSGVYLVRLERGDGDPETRKVTRIRVR
jgi:hypothetical protein